MRTLSASLVSLLLLSSAAHAGSYTTHELDCSYADDPAKCKAEQDAEWKAQVDAAINAPSAAQPAKSIVAPDQAIRAMAPTEAEIERQRTDYWMLKALH